MKRKFLNGAHFDFLELYSSKLVYIEDKFNGFISLIKVIKIKEKVTVDYEKSDKCLIDDGYKCIMFLPDNENWCASAVYDRSNKIVEWYFDMTKVNSIDEHGIPFFDDLYLDIAISPGFNPVVLDEDELKEALHLKIITQADYNLAHNTCSKLLNEVIPNKDFLVSFFNKYLVCLDN